MKKFAHIANLMIFVVALSACARVEPAKGVIKPGDKIGEMTVEQSTEIPYQSIWQFCDYGPDEQEPHSFTTKCEVPPVSSLDISDGWLATESKIESNWDAIKWEWYLDGYQIDLESFEWFEYEYTAKGEHNKSRNWWITLKNLSPGEHTFRQVWKTDIAIDDGWNVYQQGTYDQVANFTVLEKEVFPTFSSTVNIGQHPFTSEKAELDFLILKGISSLGIFMLKLAFSSQSLSVLKEFTSR